MSGKNIFLLTGTKRRGQTAVENNLHSGADMDLDKSKNYIVSKF